MFHAIREERVVLAQYTISASSYAVQNGGWSYLVTTLFRTDNGGTEGELTDARSVQGTLSTSTRQELVTNVGMWLGTMAAGTYVFQVKYHTGDGPFRVSTSLGSMG